MDEVGDAKPGGSSRFSTVMRRAGVDSDGNGGIEVLDKSSKKEKMRKLSSVNKISEMDQLAQSSCATTNSSGKRVKLPKKFFDNSNASVPRKIRSAMKKRRHESVSPTSPNSRNGSHRSESPSKDHAKKLKFNTEEQENLERSPKESIAEELSKDEEVAVEALFALAGTCPESDKAGTSEAEPLTPPVLLKLDNSKTICQTPVYNEVANTSWNLEVSVRESIHMETLKEGARPAELNLGTGLLNATIDECKNKGLEMQVDSSSSKSPNAETCAPFFMPSSAKLPAWLGNATQPCSSKRVDLIEKDSANAVRNGKKSWKRCSAHVNICRLIKVVQVEERKELTLHRGTQREATIADENPSKIMNGYADKCSSEAQNAVLLPKTLFHDQQPACKMSHEQSFDIMPWSVGGGHGVEASNSTDTAIKREAASTQFRAPYLHSFAQNHVIGLLKHPQNGHSSALDNHVSAAAAEEVPIQLPAYFGSPLYDPSQWSRPVLPKQHQMWANQYMTGACYPNWQNRRHGVMPLVSGSLAGPKHSQVSLLDILGGKHLRNAPQQQQYIPISPLLASNKGKMQLSRPPSGCDENGGLFLVDGTSPLKLTSQ